MKSCLIGLFYRAIPTVTYASLSKTPVPGTLAGNPQTGPERTFISLTIGSGVGAFSLESFSPGPVIREKDRIELLI